jgi:copper(I)-binding protein
MTSRPRTARTALRTALGAGTLAAALLLSACSTDTGSGDADLTLTDGWVKAADSGMTAAFGTLVNHTGADVTIVSASSDASRMELHEMAMGDDGQMVMRPKEDGLVVPADGAHELAPGGDHVMFMDLTAPLATGADVAVTLTSDSGSTWTFTLPVRTFTGADEHYQGSDGSTSEMPGMDMGDSSSSSGS